LAIRQSTRAGTRWVWKWRRQVADWAGDPRQWQVHAYM
jgi:hypothetical protein